MFCCATRTLAAHCMYSYRHYYCQAWMELGPDNRHHLPHGRGQSTTVTVCFKTVMDFLFSLVFHYALFFHSSYMLSSLASSDLTI